MKHGRFSEKGKEANQQGVPLYLFILHDAIFFPFVRKQGE